MKVFLTIAFFSLLATNAPAGIGELFPLQGMSLGMSIQDFEDRFPDAQRVLAKLDKDGIFVKGLALCNVDNGVFWDSALVEIANLRVESWSYVRTKDYILAKNSIGQIYSDLVLEFGECKFKVISRQLVKKGEVRSPAFIWVNDDNYVAFCHSPLSASEEGEIFICRLTIAPSYNRVNELLNIADDEMDGDKDLFVEVTNATTQHER